MFLILMIIFFILHSFWCLGVILYVILWFTIDEARTSAQKLEMRGKKVNLTNIEKTIQEEFQNVQRKVEQKIEKASVTDYIRRAGDIVRGILEGLVLLLKGIWLFISARDSG